MKKLLSIFVMVILFTVSCTPSSQKKSDVTTDSTTVVTDSLDSMSIDSVK